MFLLGIFETLCFSRANFEVSFLAVAPKSSSVPPVTTEESDGHDNENGFAGAFGGDGGTCEFPQTYISSVVTSTEGK